MGSLKVGVYYITDVVKGIKLYLFEGDSIWLTLEQAHFKYPQKDFTWHNQGGR